MQTLSDGLVASQDAGSVLSARTCVKFHREGRVFLIALLHHKMQGWSCLHACASRLIGSAFMIALLYHRMQGRSCQSRQSLHR